MDKDNITRLMTICLVVVSSLCVICAAGHASIESFFGEVDFSVVGNPKIGQPVDIMVVAKNPSVDMPDARMDILLPECIESLSGELSWHVNLTDDKDTELKGTIMVVESGNYAIQFLSTANMSGEYLFLETRFLYLYVTPFYAVVSDTPNTLLKWLPSIVNILFIFALIISFVLIARKPSPNPQSQKASLSHQEPSS